MKKRIFILAKLWGMSATLLCIYSTTATMVQDHFPMVTIALQQNDHIPPELIKTAIETIHKFLVYEFPHEMFTLKTLRDENSAYIIIYKQIFLDETRTHVRSIYEKVSRTLYALIDQLKVTTKDLVPACESLIIYPIYGSIEADELVPSHSLLPENNNQNTF